MCWPKLTNAASETKTHVMLETIIKIPANIYRPNEIPPALFRVERLAMSVDAMHKTTPKNEQVKVTIEYVVIFSYSRHRVCMLDAKPLWQLSLPEQSPLETRLRAAAAMPVI